MRKYILPATVCAAIGALVLILAMRGRTEPAPKPPSPSPNVGALKPAPKSLLDGPAETRTPLDEHKWLRELQRSLAGNLAHAMDYRHQVCADIEAIHASEKLSKDLLETIKAYIDSEDDARRDVVIPILRVFENPEATRLIAERYYRAKDEAEQMTLLEAMSKPFHDPRQATVWGVDKALNSPSAEHRERAYDILKTYVSDNELLISTSIQVYSGSLDERQRQVALRTIVDRGDVSASAREFARRILRSPSGIDDVLTIMALLPNWGTEEDAARLERLADEFPAMGDALREQARVVRRTRSEQANPNAPYHEALEKRDQEDRAREAEERKKREAEGGGGSEPAGGDAPR